MWNNLNQINRWAPWRQHLWTHCFYISTFIHRTFLVEFLVNITFFKLDFSQYNLLKFLPPIWCPGDKRGYIAYTLQCFCHRIGLAEMEGPTHCGSSIYSKLHYHNSEDFRRRLCSLKGLAQEMELKYFDKKKIVLSINKNLFWVFRASDELSSFAFPLSNQ